MKNILMLFLTFGLLISIFSCDNKDDINYILKQRITFVNETGVSPIVVTYMKKTPINTTINFDVKFDTDTTIKVGDNGVDSPGGNDTIVVKYGDLKTVKYTIYDDYNKKSPCFYKYYKADKKNDVETDFTFTFTKDMLE